MPLFVILFGAGLYVAAGFIPPPSPSMSPAQVAAMYRDHTTGIRIGMVLAMYAAVLAVPWAAAVATQFKRPGAGSPALAATQVAGVAMAACSGLVSMTCWSVAAFRPDYYSPESLTLLNDVGWILFTWTIGSLSLWEASLGFAILLDKNSEPAFPRWSGYFCFLVTTLNYPTATTIFFHRGVFAWNGVFVFWTSIGAFFVLMMLFQVLLLRSIGRERRAELNLQAHDGRVPTNG
ncbi:hypothetical protein QQY24_27740 [Streptomyces sp. TG1A-8]|uniref:hypothetical protein n=1 Tax=Streptomyces sp. TG1A-8 TaxID=3051385 RepID=UPI00265B7872|nr:hypothetical protein [Streptomyces sp. TG1A-8]MDO0929014.1 hypothetical protein [Streptomyces sp. TG1A-8]